MLVREMQCLVMLSSKGYETQLHKSYGNTQ